MHDPPLPVADCATLVVLPFPVFPFDGVVLVLFIVVVFVGVAVVPRRRLPVVADDALGLPIMKRMRMEKKKKKKIGTTSAAAAAAE